jgi:hypothetical protein
MNTAIFIDFEAEEIEKEHETVNKGEKSCPLHDLKMS